MALTVDQALAAGALAAQAQQLSNYIASIQGALAANVVLESLTCIASAGPPLTAMAALSLADSQSLLNTALTIYQAMLANVMAELQAMGS